MRFMTYVWIFAVVVALIVTVIIAIGAGGLLAMVDLEIKPHDLYGAVTGKDVDEAVQAAQEEYESIFAAASEKITVDLGEYEAEEPADEAQTSEEAGEDTEEDTKKTEFAVGASSEIAGIGEVISAGTNDIIVYKPADDGSSAPSTTVINDPNANYPLPFSTVTRSLRFPFSATRRCRSYRRRTGKCRSLMRCPMTSSRRSISKSD